MAGEATKAGIVETADISTVVVIVQVEAKHAWAVLSTNDVVE